MQGVSSVNKYLIGSILAGISLLVIFGARASNRVASWVDGGEAAAIADGQGPQAQPAFFTAQADENLTPLQQAGNLPQRQTFIEPDTTSTSISQAPTTTPPATAQPATTAGQGVVNPPADPSPTRPVRALW